MNCNLITERCIACGLCAVTAPDFFDYDDAGIVLFKTTYSADSSEKIPDSLLTEVTEAAKECPTHAIQLFR